MLTWRVKEICLSHFTMWLKLPAFCEFNCSSILLTHSSARRKWEETKQQWKPAAVSLSPWKSQASVSTLWSQGVFPSLCTMLSTLCAVCSTTTKCYPCAFLLLQPSSCPTQCWTLQECNKNLNLACKWKLWGYVDVEVKSSLDCHFIVRRLS